MPFHVKNSSITHDLTGCRIRTVFLQKNRLTIINNHFPNAVINSNTGAQIKLVIQKKKSNKLSFFSIFYVIIRSSLQHFFFFFFFRYSSFSYLTKSLTIAFVLASCYICSINTDFFLFKTKKTVFKLNKAISKKSHDISCCQMKLSLISTSCNRKVRASLSQLKDEFDETHPRFSNSKPIKTSIVACIF